MAATTVDPPSLVELWFTELEALTVSNQDGQCSITCEFDLGVSGRWFVQMSARGNCEVYSVTWHDSTHHCTEKSQTQLLCSTENFSALVMGDLSLMQAFVSGRVSLQGTRLVVLEMMIPSHITCPEYCMFACS